MAQVAALSRRCTKKLIRRYGVTVCLTRSFCCCRHTHTCTPHAIALAHLVNLNRCCCWRVKCFGLAANELFAKLARLLPCKDVFQIFILDLQRTNFSLSNGKNNELSFSRFSSIPFMRSDPSERQVCRCLCDGHMDHLLWRPDWTQRERETRRER